MLGFYVNKKGQAAWIYPDENFGRNRMHMFTPENTSIDDDIAFMVFYDLSRNVEGQSEHTMLKMPSSIQHDGGDMYSTRSRVDPSYCEKIK